MHRSLSPRAPLCLLEHGFVSVCRRASSLLQPLLYFWFHHLCFLSPKRFVLTVKIMSAHCACSASSEVSVQIIIRFLHVLHNAITFHLNPRGWLVWPSTVLSSEEEIFILTCLLVPEFYPLPAAVCTQSKTHYFRLMASTYSLLSSFLWSQANHTIQLPY